MEAYYKQNQQKYSLIPSFQSLINVMTYNRLHEQVFIEAEKDYDIKCFKFNSSFGPKVALTVWRELQAKRNSELQTSRPCNWQQNQRRLFVWFVICYCYLQKMTILQLTEQHYNELSEMFFGKQPIFLEYQCQILIKKNSRCTWSLQEDKILTQLVEDYQSGKWNQIAKEMFFRSRRKLFRTPKQCRQRWFNHLDKSKVKGEWDQSEDLKIIRFVKENGKRWAKIVPILNNARTEHMIKNRYKSILSKNGNIAQQTQRQIIERILAITDSEHKGEEQSNSTTPNLNSPNYLCGIPLFEEDSQKMKKEVSSSLSSKSDMPTLKLISDSTKFSEQFNQYESNREQDNKQLQYKQFASMFTLFNTLIFQIKKISEPKSNYAESFRFYDQGKDAQSLHVSRSSLMEIQTQNIIVFEGHNISSSPSKNIYRQVQILQSNN